MIYASSLPYPYDDAEELLEDLEDVPCEDEDEEEGSTAPG